MTDLKPDNTLFDKDNRSAKIIDLGGAVKVDSIDEFEISKYSFQSTPEFEAPELKKNDGVVDLGKAIVYACGKVAEAITKNGTDEPLI